MHGGEKTRVVDGRFVIGSGPSQGRNCMERALSRGPEHFSGGDCGLHPSESQKSLSHSTRDGLYTCRSQKSAWQGSSAWENLRGPAIVKHPSHPGSLFTIIRPASAVDAHPLVRGLSQASTSSDLGMHWPSSMSYRTLLAGWPLGGCSAVSEILLRTQASESPFSHESGVTAAFPPSDPASLRPKP
jgi:hypothetical protein